MKNRDLPWIASLIVDGEPSMLTVLWKDGDRSAVNLSGWIATNPILAPLRDRAMFETARVGDYGADVQWGDDDDLAIDADHLRMIAEEQRPFRSEEFRQWQAKMHLSNAEAADFLHVALSTFNAYKAGTSVVPMRVAMLCRAAARDPIFMHAHYRPRAPAGRPRKSA